MERSFLNVIEKRHLANSEAEKSINLLIDQIDMYEASIPEFFSVTGEAEGIKKMYKEIEKSLGGNLTEEKSIFCADITNNHKVYMEYVDGMMKFIYDINNIVVNESTSEELEKFSSKFESAKKNDSLFIESLFTGELSKPSVKPLSEAVSNIEFLIEFVPSLNKIKNDCIVLSESVIDDSNATKKELINHSLEMLYESVDNYSYNVLKNIVECYYNINDVLFNEEKPKDESKKFQLF